MINVIFEFDWFINISDVDKYIPEFKTSLIFNILDPANVNPKLLVLLKITSIIPLILLWVSCPFEYNKFILGDKWIGNE